MTTFEAFLTAKPVDPAPAPAPQAYALEELDLSSEIMANYVKAKKLYDDALFDDETPANQKAQVLNTITAILASMVKMRTELLTSERIKKLEFCLIETMKVQPKDVQDAFFALYSRHLDNLE